MTTTIDGKANIAVIGAGWWSQGWHLPHLHHTSSTKNKNVKLAAIVDASDHPKSNLNPNLESLKALGERYDVPVYHSVTELLDDPNVGPRINGVIICTPHSTHYEIGELIVRENMRRQEQKGSHDTKPPPIINILMEKPMTTNVHDALKLYNLVISNQRNRRPHDNNDQDNGDDGCFLVNHSANYRTQTRVAQDLISQGRIGTIRHVTAFFASPLCWIFDDPANKGWNEPDSSGTMLGNGFAWGQSSHILAWVYHVTQIQPRRVYCVMNHSEKTGADVSHSASISCTGGVTFALSGTCLLPGNEHSDQPPGKLVRVEIFGSNGALIYTGNDRDQNSGRLEFRRGEQEGKGDDEHHCVGEVEVQCPELGFQFEDVGSEGCGPASLQNFIRACLGGKADEKEEDGGYYVGADVHVGLKTVQTIDAMYRSHASGNAEDVLCSD